MNYGTGAGTLACLLLLAGCAHGDGSAVDELNRRLLAHPSATAVLEQWCADRRLAPVPHIAARRGAARKPAPADVRAALQAAPDETLGYRQVQLVCGERVLSEADNWYVPARLTAEMNRALDETDAPFGRVVSPLNFSRRTLSSRRTPPGGPHVLENRAVLFAATGEPFSYVVERYTSAAVAAPH